MAHKNFIAIILVPLILIFCAQPKSTTSSQLGEVQFTATGKKDALSHFEKGLLLLHSFEYDDAAEEFKKARAIDPAFVMAYWGEAMTYNHPLWRYQDYEKATAVLQALAASPEERAGKAKTEIEKDFISSLAVLYGKGSKAERDKKYANFMESLYKKYEGNPEVSCFYSLALIGSVEVGRDEAVYGKAANIAKEVLAKNPRHPGALHYLIHAYDDPGHAAQALATADAYALTAPDAGHALHMPTHIYLALGMWDKVVTSNEVSWAAGEKRKKRKRLSNNALNYHAFHWLLYGYLQQGEKEKARKVLQDMKKYSDELASGRARAHMIFIKTTYLTETRDWDPAIVSIRVLHKDLNM
jgi:tetratricopeptide (TPR) repeat protein